MTVQHSSEIGNPHSVQQLRDHEGRNGTTKEEMDAEFRASGQEASSDSSLEHSHTVLDLWISAVCMTLAPSRSGKRGISGLLETTHVARKRYSTYWKCAGEWYDGMARRGKECPSSLQTLCWR